MSRLSSTTHQARGRDRVWKRNLGTSTWLLIADYRNPYDAPLASLTKQWNGGWLLRYGDFNNTGVNTVPFPKSEDPPFDAAEAMFDLIN